MTKKRSGHSLPASPPKKLKTQGVASRKTYELYKVAGDISGKSKKVLPIFNQGVSERSHAAGKEPISVQIPTSLDLQASAELSIRTPDSVGPCFPAIPTMTNDFLKVFTTADLRPARLMGITNRSMHCYRNSVLTAFLSSPIVIQYLLRWHCSGRNGEYQNTSSSVIAKISHLAVTLFFPTNPPDTHTQESIDAVVEQFWRQFCYERDSKGARLVLPSPGTWRQHCGDANGAEERDPQDAREFLTWLLNAIPTQFRVGMPGWQSGAPLERFQWVFNGQLACRILCRRCRYPVRRRNKAELASCLMLYIPYARNTPGRMVPQPFLNDLVKQLFSEEIHMQCTRCRRVSNCAYERKLLHAPALLTLCISRGKYDMQTRQMGKDCSAVVIPEQLDLSQHLNAHQFGSGSQVTYTLRSVVSHAGNQLDTGHYVSYVRGGTGDSEWFEINDQVVAPTALSQFDESAVADLNEDEYLERFTPYILFYERNFATEVVTPGREALNVGEGEVDDEQPSHWTGIEREVTPSVTDSQSEAESRQEAKQQQEDEDEDEESEEESSSESGQAWTVGPKGDAKSLPAVLLVKINIGDVEIELPRHVISHLNWKIKRDIMIDVKLRAPKGRGLTEGKSHVEASLSNMQDEAYYLGRQSAGRIDKSVQKQVQKQALAWNKYWNSVERSADDLTEDQIDDIKQVCREQDGDFQG